MFFDFIEKPERSSISGASQRYDKLAGSFFLALLLSSPINFELFESGPEKTRSRPPRAKACHEPTIKPHSVAGDFG